MPLRPRADAVSGGGSSGGRSSTGGMDLGTRALVLGVGSVAGSWIPLLNIVAFVAALMAIGFGALARWPTGWITSQEPDPKRALWGICLGVVALVVFTATSVIYAR